MEIADQIRDLKGAAERASAAVWEIQISAGENIFGSDALPREMPEPLHLVLRSLERELHGIGELASGLFERLCAGPSHKLLAGKPLSQEEYYLVRASGVDFGGAKDLGLTDLTDYEVYRMLCYEDDRRWSYINVHLSPRDPQSQQVSARFGCPPEECRRRFLRPEQETFFRDRFPKVYERFSND